MDLDFILEEEGENSTGDRFVVNSSKEATEDELFESDDVQSCQSVPNSDSILDDDASPDLASEQSNSSKSSIDQFEGLWDEVVDHEDDDQLILQNE